MVCRMPGCCPSTPWRRLGREAPIELRLRYHLALLEPHHFRLPSDGQRHAVPKLGYCRAKREPAGGRMEVSCFSGFGEPAKISAELGLHSRRRV